MNPAMGWLFAASRSGCRRKVAARCGRAARAAGARFSRALRRTAGAGGGVLLEARPSRPALMGMDHRHDACWVSAMLHLRPHAHPGWLARRRGRKHVRRAGARVDDVVVPPCRPLSRRRDPDGIAAFVLGRGSMTTGGNAGAHRRRSAITPPTWRVISRRIRIRRGQTAALLATRCCARGYARRGGRDRSGSSPRAAGPAFLRRAWINMNVVWAGALVA